MYKQSAGDMLNEGLNVRSRKQAILITICTGVLLIVAVLVALCVGRYAMTPSQVFSVISAHLFHTSYDVSGSDDRVIMLLRLPRIAAAMLVGAALAVAGATYQGVFRNPLVAPDILGVSSGACVGAAGAILLGCAPVAVQVCAFIGGIIAVLITMAIPTFSRRNTVLMLVLSGIICAGFFNSMLGLIKYIADPETQLPEIVYWMLGSVAHVELHILLFAGVPICIALIASIALSWRINLLSLSDEEAHALGVNVKLERVILIGISTVLTACAVCIAGTIGWIGLVIPHLARLLVGSSNTRVIPLSALAGATFLLVVDTFARTVSTGEVPLGVVTGFIGTPLFALLLISRRNEVGNG